jgi:RNA polymerase sigma-70 factor, ECF subfamily
MLVRRGDIRAASSKELQAALLLVEMLGYPLVEAAEILGVPEGTIKSRAARGRAALAARMGHAEAQA